MELIMFSPMDTLSKIRTEILDTKGYPLIEIVDTSKQKLLYEGRIEKLFLEVETIKTLLKMGYSFHRKRMLIKRIFSNNYPSLIFKLIMETEFTDGKQLYRFTGGITEKKKTYFKVDGKNIDDLFYYIDFQDKPYSNIINGAHFNEPFSYLQVEFLEKHLFATYLNSLIQKTWQYPNTFDLKIVSEVIHSKNDVVELAEIKKEIISPVFRETMFSSVLQLYNEETNFVELAK